MMRYGDPAEVTCNQCGKASEQFIADLLDLSARCPACHADLSEHGRAMHRDMDRIKVQLIIFEMLCEIEDELRIEFPDSFLDSFDIATSSPATFAGHVEPVVRELLQGRSFPHLPFDLHADGDAGTADDTPWIQKLDPNRFAERVAAYPKPSAVTASANALPRPPDQEGGKRSWEKYRYH